VTAEGAREDLVAGESAQPRDLGYGARAREKRRRSTLESKSLRVLLWRLAQRAPQFTVKVKG
jgi:hypothetical protein